MNIQNQIDKLYDYIEKFGDITISELIGKIIQTEKTYVPKLEEYQKQYLNTYHKYCNDTELFLIHIKDVYFDDDELDFIATYDQLIVTNYEKISYSLGSEESIKWMFEIPYEEITEAEWIKELCYYFKRIPGNDDEICCP